MIVDFEIFTDEEIVELFGESTVFGVIDTLRDTFHLESHSVIEDGCLCVVDEQGDYFYFDENGLFTDVCLDCWCC